LPAGVVDTSFASLATFVVALVAVTQFDDVDRGVYAVFFTAFLAGGLLASELVFTPVEIQAVSFPTSQRISFVPKSLRLGIGPCLAGALAVPIAVAVTAGYATAETATGLALTSVAAVVISPMQDHVRRMLHLSELSWEAASVSIVQLLVASVSVVIALALDTPTAIVPFGALTVANVISLAFAVVVARRSLDDDAHSQLRLGELSRRGIWFVLNATAPALAAFAVAAIVAWLASPEDLGYAESARVVAQPVLVFAGGLSVVLTPRSMRAAMDRDLPTARRTRTIYLSGLAVAGLGYIAIAGWDWVLNPMVYIVPSAYVLGGLVAVSVIANVVMAATFLQGAELAGAGRERSLTAISWLAAIVWVLGGFTAGVTGAFARPLGATFGGSFKYGVQARVIAALYNAQKPRAP
jgi:O-antigen/teichoic acid export membrane protein